MNTAIIVAAGSGSRFGGDIPKQFRSLQGKSVLFHTISKFEECETIDKIILVVAGARLDFASQFRTDAKKISEIVSGGNTRSESVRNGLDAVSGNGIVAIHDGARPLVTVEEIGRTIKAAEEFGAACLVMPVADTLKVVRGGRIVETIDRGTVRRAATPQCFNVDILRKAFLSGIEDMTDESMLLEKLGLPVAVVEGSSRNIKITFEDDMNKAAALLEIDARAGRM